MRKSERPHSLRVCFDPATQLINISKCSCKAGLSGRCSHLVGLVQALMHYQQWGMNEIPTEMSCTELQQRVVPSTTEAIEQLRGLTGTPLAYLLNSSLPTEETVLGPVQVGSPLPFHADKYEDKQQASDILPCGDTAFPLAPEVGSYPAVPPQYIQCNSVCPITLDQARKLERDTVKQADSGDWFKARENRITASNFHKIHKRVKDFNNKFTESIMSAPKSVSSIPCSYGTAHESIAKGKYCERKASVHLHDCGFVVNPQFSFIGATPDAKVCCKGVTGIVEVKCPYSARDMTVGQAVQQLPRFCLCESIGKLTLDRGNDYYCQVQGQLLVTGAPFCDFIVYTKCDLFIERIFPDHDFQREMMDKLSSFYCNYGLPHMQSKTC
ncbi:hypothetical protein BaRGS_00019544 [Batillaria attramentaria]|uniref:SWIM-type domain-containing protein n=1 Tax=Batillaria attramentaria TaxID=370345 RepID=A0ABD0KQ39_9CAEN